MILKELSPIQKKILQYLEDNARHSGNELGQQLGVSRTAIWKHIKQLKTMGIPITQIPQQGYQLKQQLILLNEEKITQQLEHHHFGKKYTLHVVTSIHSTNRYLKELPPGNTIDICCAEEQTAGRGRFGRNWQSPFGENIYCSSRWSFHGDLNKLSGLSLVVSLAALATIKQIHPSDEFKIKWPNDLYWQDKKICGSLIEIIAESNGNALIIIGIGLNVNSDHNAKLAEDRPWSSLYQITKCHYDRNELTALLLCHLERYLARFNDTGFSAFMTEWKQSDYLFGKYIEVNQALGCISGTSMGVNDEGLLKVEDPSGMTHIISSGDASLSVCSEHF